MITKYELSGTVSDTDKVISSYVSVPLGITKEQFAERVDSFKRAFSNVKITVSYTG